MTAEQKTRMRVLEEALRLSPLVYTAQGANLLGGLGYVVWFTSSSDNGQYTRVDGAVLGGVGCAERIRNVLPSLAAPNRTAPRSRAMIQ